MPNQTRKGTELTLLRRSSTITLPCVVLSRFCPSAADRASYGLSLACFFLSLGGESCSVLGS